MTVTFDESTEALRRRNSAQTPDEHRTAARELLAARHGLPWDHTHALQGCGHGLLAIAALLGKIHEQLDRAIETNWGQSG